MYHKILILVHLGGCQPLFAHFILIARKPKLRRLHTIYGICTACNRYNNASLRDRFYWMLHFCRCCPACDHWNRTSGFHSLSFIEVMSKDNVVSILTLVILKTVAHYIVIWYESTTSTCIVIGYINGRLLSRIRGSAGAVIVEKSSLLYQNLINTNVAKKLNRGITLLPKRHSVGEWNGGSQSQCRDLSLIYPSNHLIGVSTMIEILS